MTILTSELEAEPWAVGESGPVNGLNGEGPAVADAEVMDYSVRNQEVLRLMAVVVAGLEDR